MTSMKDSLSSKIGVKIRLLRTKNKISQESLAFMSGLNKNSIGAIERGESSPTVDTLDKIAKALGMSLVELIDVSKVDL